MPRQQLYEYKKEGLVTYWRDAARTGIMFAQAHGGRAAGADICVERGWGSWADLKGRTDLIAIPGAEVFAWDVGQAGVYFVSDGTNWRPRDGSQLLYQRFGTIAAPLDAGQLLAAYSFTPPQVLLIPGGVIAPHSALRVEAIVRRTAGTAAGTANVRLGTAGTTADSLICNLAITTSVNTTANFAQPARFGSATDRFTTLNMVPPNGQQSNGADRTVNVNTAADMRVTFDISGSATTNQFALLGYAIYLEG